jgi:uncharacterized cupin superfamily protein
VNLTPSPIDPSWIIKGNPVAQSALLAKSADGLARTMVWQCSEGSFNWFYDLDETIMILEGSIVLESEGMPPKRYGVGDVIFFRSGAHAKWHVEGLVKKVAFLRHTIPWRVGLAVRALNKLKRKFFAPGGHRTGRVNDPTDIPRNSQASPPHMAGGTE